MTEQAKVPAIRFAGFTDPWEQRKFVDFVEASGIRNKDNLQLESYSVSNDRGFVPQDEQFENGGTMRDADKTAYWIVEPGSFAYNPARINVGSIGYQSTRKNVIVSSLYEVFKTDHSCDDRFLWHWFKSSLFTKQIEMLQEGGVRLYFFFDKLQKSEIWMPNVDEQRIIGQQFDQLDSLITLHQRKYDKLVVFKKSMLEKMFPKDGESVPEIRFAGFTDPWEQRKLGDVASSFDYGLNAAATEYDGQNKYLRITDIDDETHEFSKSDLTTPLADLAMSADYLLKEGDLLFARTGASVGKTYLYRQFDGMVYFAGFLIRARIGEGADPEFAYQATLTDAYKKYVAITSQRSGQPGVNAQEYADYQLMLPSKTEQQQIGMTLRSLDDLITLHQRKLELLQNIKKSLLDKMFV